MDSDRYGKILGVKKSEERNSTPPAVELELGL